MNVLSLSLLKYLITLCIQKEFAVQRDESHPGATKQDDMRFH